MSYAIIRTGGKQYRVKQGDRLRVEKLVAEVGQEVELGDVLARGEGSELKFGNDAAGPVKVKVVRHGRGPKIQIWKSKRRKGYQKRQGHRQDFTEILVVSI
jgi:large subunit ribosomal protein L21